MEILIINSKGRTLCDRKLFQHKNTIKFNTVNLIIPVATAIEGINKIDFESLRTIVIENLQFFHDCLLNNPVVINEVKQYYNIGIKLYNDPIVNKLIMDILKLLK